MDSLRSQLLVASPQLMDPNFARTVVLITEHNDDGAMGIVLNRPATTSVTEAAPELEDLVEPGDDVFVGGPVQPSSVIVLAEWDSPEQTTVRVFDSIGFGGARARPPPAALRLFAPLGFVGAAAAPEELARTVSRPRVFAGFAGWSSGQLEAELE